MATLKHRLISSLAIRRGPLIIRLWERMDVDHLADWPRYEFPYEPFNLCILGENSQRERDEYFRKRNSDKSRIYLAVDHLDCLVIGLLILVDIDWSSGTVGNMGIRIRSDWCNRGIGTSALLMLCDWAFGSGLKRVRLDVAAPNQRAIRCYEKAGFRVVGEFWRDDLSLSQSDIGKLESASVPIKSHSRFNKGVPQLRFFWMEAVPKDSRKG